MGTRRTYEYVQHRSLCALQKSYTKCEAGEHCAGYLLAKKDLKNGLKGCIQGRLFGGTAFAGSPHALTKSGRRLYTGCWPKELSMASG